MRSDPGAGDRKPAKWGRCRSAPVHNRRLLSTSLLTVVAALFLLLPSLVAGTAWAQAPRPQVTVDSQAATPHFPDTVDFTLKAHGYEAYQAELNYRLAGDPVTQGIDAPINTPTSNLDLKVTLDLGPHYIPPGAEVTYYWTLTGDTARDVDTPEKTFTMVDDRYGWNELTDPQKRVTVHWHDGTDAFGQALLSSATDGLNRLKRDTGVVLERPAGIWIYSTQDELLGALPKNIPEWVGGKALPDLALVLAAIAPDSTAQQEIGRIVPHELSHLALYQATLNPYNSPPAWMDEGLAMHNQTVFDPTEEQAVKAAAEEGRLVPLNSLSGSFGATEEAAVLAYGESRSVIDFILKDSRYGPEKLARTVAAFRDGVTYDDAFKAGLGVTVDELDRQWRESLPYKVAAPGTTQTTASGATPTGQGPFAGLPVYVGIAVASICAFIFLVGAILTLVVLIRRSGATRSS